MTDTSFALNHLGANVVTITLNYILIILTSHNLPNDISPYSSYSYMSISNNRRTLKKQRSAIFSYRF